MQGLTQFILGNLWILVPILIGLFNVAVRLQQKAKEQRAKRAALAEIQRRKSEALRTGKPMTEPLIVYDEPQKKQPSPGEDRQARIEALRQQRIAQLRAIREKRSGAAAQSATASPPARPGAAPAGRAQPAPTRPQPPRQQQAQRSAPSSPAPTQRPPSRPRVAPSQPAPQPKLPEVPGISPGVDSSQASNSSEPGQTPGSSAYGIQSRSGRGEDAGGARTLLKDPQQLRNAIVLREILNQPIALRAPDDAPGGMVG